MKLKLYFLALIFTACASNENQSVEGDRTADIPDSLSVDKRPLDHETVVPGPGKEKDDVDRTSPEILDNKKAYSNQRFRNVTVERINEQQFRIKGQGQIFEAAFSWVIEDGHEELKKGFEMTNAGAPEWGDFNFVVDAPKKRANSTLHLILYEVSAKDGSRQYELPIPLY